MKAQFTFYFFLTALLLFGFHQTCSQDTGFIYGQVTTIDGDQYTGALRWGKEEVFWTDMFNASKEKNPNLDHLSREELDDLRNRRNSGWSGNNWIQVNWDGEWGNSDEDFTHQFGCQFGEIKKIVPYRRQGADVFMQNGTSFEVDGQGYNDIGTKVRVHDPELGVIELSWSRIEEVEFMPTPAKLDRKFGEPLYGVVESTAGKFTGFVQWDHDERVGTDVLDGDNQDGDVSIAFENIASIKRYGSSRSIVVLKSGRELTLRGSNDVNDENRGIIVTVEGMGRVDIPWDEFDKVTFSKAPGSGPAYKDFSNQAKLEGKVEAKGGANFTGEVIFDLDETYNFEVLQGKLDDVELIIPFRNIREIALKNYDYSSVTLKNGDTYLLGESQDVSDRNQGVVIIQGAKTKYINYAGIERISFR